MHGPIFSCTHASTGSQAFDRATPRNKLVSWSGSAPVILMHTVIWCSNKWAIIESWDINFTKITGTNFPFYKRARQQ
jgi:hypothetical protein